LAKKNVKLAAKSETKKKSKFSKETIMSKFAAKYKLTRGLTVE
jgi:hypothetical protein